MIPQMLDIGAYSGLFTAAFLAATLIPAQSEAGLAALVVAGGQDVAMLVLVASLGNILGAVVNWYIGRCVDRFKDRKWFPASAAQLDNATIWYQRYGRWSLLLSWVPFIGDPITVVAGILRTPLLSFLLIVGFAKTARYVVIAAMAASWI
jgi:membrane protein YqaA with SNARE-associated domain